MPRRNKNERTVAGIIIHIGDPEPYFPLDRDKHMMSRVKRDHIDPDLRVRVRQYLEPHPDPSIGLVDPLPTDPNAGTQEILVENNDLQFDEHDFEGSDWYNDNLMQ
jgi:hypothetical protein